MDCSAPFANYVLAAAVALLALGLVVLVHALRRARLAALGERALNACGGDWPTVLEAVRNMEWTTQEFVKNLSRTEREWLESRPEQ